MDSYSKLKQISMENLAKDEEILNLKSEILSLKRELISKSEGLVCAVAAIQEMGFSQELEFRLGTTLKAICPELEESEAGKDDQTNRSATKPKNKAKEKQITPAKGKENEKQPSPKKLKEVELVSKYALKDLGQVEAWTSIIKNSHPGSLSSLRKQQRDTIQECIEDYLKQNVGAEWVDCYVIVKETPQIGIPEKLVEDFLEYFDVKIEQGILNSTPASNKAKTPKPDRKSLPLKAEEICKMFIPNNEYASTLLDIVEQEYPTLVIPLQKFTVLIESMSDMKEGNSRFIGGADANKIRGKFKAVFGQEISKQQPSRPAKRSSNQSTEQPKKIPKVDNTATSERYSNLLSEILPTYTQSAYDDRVTMKKKVKGWLMTKLESDFVQSISTVANGNKPPHKTYNIPRVFWNEFQKWAEKEMRDLGMM